MSLNKKNELVFKSEVSRGSICICHK